MDPFKYTKAYQERVGNDPRLDIPLLTAGSGLAAYLLAGPAIRALSNIASVGGNQQMQDAVNSYLAPNGDINAGKRRLAILASAAGALYGMYKHVDWKNGLEGAKQSLLTPNYWERNPQARAAYEKPVDVKPELAAISMDKQAWDEGYRESFHNSPIPVGMSINAFRQDPFLLPYNRNKITSLVADSANGLFTTPASMVNTALKAGVNFGAAYMFGTGVGKLLAMPEPLVNRVAMTGGLSAAVVGSGILKHL